MQMILTRWINRNFRGKEMGEQGVLRKTLEALSEAVFPSNIYCACCGRLIDGTRPYALCDSVSMKRMHWNNGRTCEKCGKALPETYRGGLMLRAAWTYAIMSFRKGYSCLTYGLHEREMLLDFKYNGRGYLAGKNSATSFMIRIPLGKPDRSGCYNTGTGKPQNRAKGSGATISRHCWRASLAERWGRAR